MEFVRLCSLKSLILAMVLTMFLVSIGFLTFGIHQILRSDMEKALGDQQVATVNLVAEGISASFKERAEALKLIAGEFDASTLDRPDEMQERLGKMPLLQVMFNAGVFVTRADGTAIAEMPRIGRTGLNYMDRDHVAAALQEGRASVGKAVMGKMVKAPSFAMTVPIRDAQGVVIGALTGATDLSKPNFLDSLINSYYGASGGYLIIDPKHRIFVTATANNKRLVMQPLPAPGVNPVLDRRLLGFDGTAVNVSSLGIEVLTSSSRIHVADWLVISTLPTHEAFAPLRRLDRQLAAIALVLTLLSLGLTWWMLQRLLAPMQRAAVAVGKLAKEGAGQGPLPVARHDEIGQLIDGFNQVLEVSNQREKALRESECHLRTIVESISEGLVTQDSSGKLLSSNLASQRILGLSSNEMQGLTSVGSAWGSVVHEDETPYAATDLPELEALRTGAVVRDRVMGINDPRTGRRWISVNAVPLFLEGAQAPSSLVTTFVDITDRKNIELALHESEARYARVMDGTGESFWEWDLASKAVIVSARFEAMLGYAPGEWVRTQQNWRDHIHPDDAGPLVQRFQKHLLGETPRYDNVFRMKTRQGQWVWIESRGKVVARSAAGEPTLVAGTHTDITRQRLAEDALKTMNKDFVTLLETSTDFLYFKDRDGRIRYCSQSLANITGHKGWRDMVGKRDVEVFPSEAAKVYFKDEGPIFSEARPLLDQIEPYVKPDGSPGWVSTNKWPMFADDGKTVVGLFGVSRDVTDAKRLESELLLMATTDFLTGASSRRSFVAAIDREIARMQRDADTTCALLMVDLDHFKLINDTYGHATGDEVLKHVVQLLGSEIRKGDLIGRMGGEEFAILMPGANMTSAQTFAERMRQTIERAPVTIGGKSIVVTVSIGVSSLRAGDVSSGAALARVDQALYGAKHKGRNRMEVSA